MNARFLGATLLALSAFAAVPAAAQVAGIGVADLPVAVAGSQARVTGYQQIGTTFQGQRGQIEGLQTQRAGLLRRFDTDNNGQLSDAEGAVYQADTATVQQVEALQQQLNAIQDPITLASIYVIEQVAVQLTTAVQQVIQANSIQIILSPGSTLYVADPVDLTDEIITQLNALVPTVQITPPQGWQPSQQGVNLYQQVQEILVVAQQQQAAAQQQQQQQGPAAPAVQGR